MSALATLAALLALAAPPPISEIARSKYGFRAVDITASGASSAIIWARRGATSVRVDDHPPVDVFETSQNAAILPAADGFLAIADMPKGNGFWQEHGRRLNAAGAAIEPARIIRAEPGDITKGMLWTRGGPDTLLMIGTFYHPASMWRIAPKVGAKPRSSAFTAPATLATKTPHRVSPWGLGGGPDTIELLWSDHEAEGRLNWSRVASDDTVRTLGVALDRRIRSARFADDRWTLATDHDKETRFETLVERDGKLAVETHGETRLPPGCGQWHGDRLLWLAPTGSRANRRMALRAIELDGSDRRGPWVVDPNPGPAHDRAHATRSRGERCLAITDTHIVAVWMVQDGRETVLRRAMLDRALIEEP